MLKAHISFITKGAPPKIHSLLTLLDLSSLESTSEQRAILGEMNEFCIEGRYESPEQFQDLDYPRAMHYIGRTERALTWLREKLPIA